LKREGFTARALQGRSTAGLTWLGLLLLLLLLLLLRLCKVRGVLTLVLLLFFFLLGLELVWAKVLTLGAGKWMGAFSTASPPSPKRGRGGGGSVENEFRGTLTFQRT